MERATLLLEIGCEELPAAFMRGTLEQLQAKLAETLHENRLEHGVVRTLGTPRRLIALADAVAPCSRRPKSASCADPPSAPASTRRATRRRR
jgi:glycyl-tRNA synthetase beta subunit